jgi:hypothetical protein
MMQTVPQWAISVMFATGPTYSFRMSEPHLSTVLRTFSTLSFPAPVVRLEIVLTPPPSTQAQTGILTAMVPEGVISPT